MNHLDHIQALIVKDGKVVPCVGEGGTDRCLNFAFSDEGLKFLRTKKGEEFMKTQEGKAILTDPRSLKYFNTNEGIDFFDDKIWDELIPKNSMTLVPGVNEILTHCEEHDVEVFSVTNRDQGPDTLDLALKQRQYLGLPFTEREHPRDFTNSSDKTPARDSVSQTHELVLLLGDNLNDFKRDYYLDDVEQRFALLERDKNELGDRFVLLPNPTDGHWVRALFGESEPIATEGNRRALFDATIRGAWDGT